MLEGPDGPHVAAVARQGESHVVAEAPDAHPAVVAGEPDGCRAAEADRLGGLPGADCCAAGSQAAAQPRVGSAVEAVAAACLADGLAARVWSVESQAGDYFPAVPAEALVDDCSPAACPDTAGAAARGPGPDDSQMADAEPGQDDRCPKANCESPEEQADCQERQAEEHYRLDGPERCYLEHHYSGRQDEVHSGYYPERRDGDRDCCSADPGDCRGHYSAGRDEALRHDCRVR